MSYNAEDNFPEVDRVFSPNLYDDETLAFILDHLGENPMKAMQDFDPSALGIERWQFRDVHGKDHQVVDSAEDQYQVAVRNKQHEIERALRRFHDLDELQDNEIQTWIGADDVAAGIKRWQKYRELYTKTKRSDPRGVGHHPSMSTYDSRNREYWAGPGSDVGRVRKYDIELYSAGVSSRGDFTKEIEDGPSQPGREVDPRTDDSVPENLRFGEDYVGCPICTYQKQYDPDSRTEHNDAINAVKMHMLHIKKNVDEHREALLKIKAVT